MIRPRPLLAFLLLCSLVPAGCSGPAPPGREREAIDLRELERRVAIRVNEYRVSVKKPPFESNEGLEKIARAHSRDMAEGKVGFGHEGLQERPERVAASIAIERFAENVSRHDRSAGFVDAALEQWLGSPRHKKNIDGHYDLAGVGAARGADGVVYFTQIFVKKR